MEEGGRRSGRKETVGPRRSRGSRTRTTDPPQQNLDHREVPGGPPRTAGLEVGASLSSRTLSASQPVSQPVSQSVSQSTSESTSQLTSESVSESVFQSVSQQQVSHLQLSLVMVAVFEL